MRLPIADDTRSELIVEARPIDLVIEKVVQRMFDPAEQQLVLKIDSEESRAGIDMFVASHGEDKCLRLKG